MIPITKAALLVVSLPVTPVLVGSASSVCITIELLSLILRMRVLRQQTSAGFDSWTL